MKHFNFLNEEQSKEIFFKQPEFIDRDSSREVIARALGATLYMPATKRKIAEDIIKKKHVGLTSMVLCLEDAIGDREIEKAENALLENLKKIKTAIENGEVEYQDVPFIFVRVRNSEQILRLFNKCGSLLKLLTGFCFSKFSCKNGKKYFDELKKINQKLKKTLYGMPILETEDIIYIELRRETLYKINEILQENNDLVLNIRIGATDFSSLFGIRRSCDTTVYDIHVIRDCITDIINFFCRVDRDYVLSGPVWEYFSSGDRILKPKLRVTPFAQKYGKTGLLIRTKLLNQYIDGLINEVLLDRANGLIGKTVIHPSHILPVNSLYAVSHEEYIDAISILDNNNGEIGVFKSSYSNKMNEVKPHKNWAEKILQRAKIYGVYNKNQDFTSLIK
ncbi:Citrate lyase beta subunit [Caminicella sporogenes DSM 14501]|uniref:Citrate lyase beta subunit n=1 Tax=Caminicella sporogenes DSM 14501 TaxID=1121266 RepID=A0A1M6QLL3_9FIRM|nr:HpcH/HpaI aldolase/citrate lyase family protein [Caminicella sporogenes]RKD25275.1 citrate lyase subunit beta [Caminicella sporogenes]WIF95268.1 HpcH/HpaI aldolase/citrate lyase family protein [Caminicella sporogenes]SHK20907.1 Citrate lyase beta subunit [Caminicella sporogenes DSM 14501]